MLPKQNSKVIIFIISFKLIDLFFTSKQGTIITIAMQSQEKFYICFTKINTKIFLRRAETPINIIIWSLT